MRRWLIRIGIALVIVVALSTLALAIALPRIVNREEFRVALNETVSDALGTPVEWQTLDAGLLPPRLTIEAPRLVARDTSEENARFVAESIDLRLSPTALLSRRVQIDSLVLSGVEVVVTRTEDGFVLPLSTTSTESGDGAESGDPDSVEGDAADPNVPAVVPEPAGEGEFELALRRFVLVDTRIIVRDQTLAEPVEWRLEGVTLEARGDSLDEPLDLEFASDLHTAARPIGRIAATGSASLDGLFDIDLDLDEVVLDAIQPYVTDIRVGGLLSGRVSVEGGSDVLAAIETDLALEEMDIEAFGLDLEGRLDLDATQRLDEPAAIVATFDLGEGGRAAIDGTVSLEGAVVAVAKLAALDLAPFASLAGEGQTVAGLATGDVDFAVSAEGGLEKLETDLSIASARYADGTNAVAGELELRLGLTGVAENDPIRFDVAIDLASGGRASAVGVATTAGSVDAELVFAGVDLAVAKPYVPPQTQLGGILTGDVDVKLAADRTIERLKTKLGITSARLVSDPVDVSGTFDLAATLEETGLVALRTAITLGDGSGLEVVGTSTVDGVLDVEAKLEKFDLAIARPFLPEPEMKLAGWATGDAKIVGPAASPEYIGFDLFVDAGAFETEEYSVVGPFLAEAKVEDPLTRPRGRIDLDLTAARLAYLDQFEKKAGMKAEMVTRFVPQESGEILFESKLKLRNIDEILIEGAIADTTSVAVTTSTIELKGWDEVFPLLAPYELDGRMSVDGLGVELKDGTPTRFGGRLALSGIGLTVPDAGRVRLRGAILGEGQKIRTKGLVALIGGATVRMQGAIEEPMGEGRFDFELKTQGKAEANDLLSELTSTRDTVYGPLTMSAKVTGALDRGGLPVTETLDGTMGFKIGEPGGGRLRGVSILRTVLDQIPLLGGAGKLTKAFRGEQSVDDYFTEEFEIIEGDFVIGSGQVQAKTLRLSYPTYEARLSGPLRLGDLAVDMTGELLLKGDLVTSVGGAVGADMAKRKPIRIPLARVTQTLNDPKITMTAETLAAVPKLLFQGIGLDTIASGVGKAIGRAIGGGK